MDAHDAAEEVVEFHLGATELLEELGNTVLRGIMEERDLPASIQRDLFDKIAFPFPESEMSLAMPVPGHGDDTRPVHRRYYFIWYRPADAAALRDLCTDANGVHHLMSIPPPLIRADVIARTKEEAGTLFAPDLAAVIRRTPQPLLQAITDLESPRLVIGRVVLLGDAAFVARPHVGAGVIASNLKSLPGNVTVEKDGVPFDTGLRKFGALVGDGAEVGCNSVLNPGSIIGRGAMIYPGVNWRGILPANMIAKNKAQIDVVVRRLRDT